MSNVAIIGCSRRKIATSAQMKALDLYQGGGVPAIRSRVGKSPELRKQVFILSGKYGLLCADDLITNYDLVLTLERADELKPMVFNDFRKRILNPLKPEEILVVAEPLYFELIARVLCISGAPRIYWEPNVSNDSILVSTVLDSWGWTK